MTAFICDNILDNGLAYLVANGDRLDICSTQPTTYTQATATYTLGNATCVPGALGNGATSGRKTTIGAISGGSVTGTGTAGYFGITDGSSELLVAGALSAPQSVTQNNTFTLTAFDVTIPDAA